jgi:hypothetical protein
MGRPVPVHLRIRADWLVGGGAVLGAVAVAFASARFVAGPAFILAGLLFMISARHDVAGVSNFRGNRRALNVGVAAIGVIWIALGIGILAH